MKRTVSSNEIFRITQGYTAWNDCNTEDPWRACWAHLSTEGLICYPHQYSKEPIQKFVIDADTTCTTAQDPEMPNKIEIKFGEDQSHTIQLALQSRIDANRWITGINNLVRVQPEKTEENTDSPVRENGTANKYHGGSVDIVEEKKQELSESVSITESSESEITSFTGNVVTPRLGSELFVSKEKKKRSERIKPSPSDELKELTPEPTANSLRDAITRDIALNKKAESKEEDIEDVEVPLPKPSPRIKSVRMDSDVKSDETDTEHSGESDVLRTTPKRKKPKRRSSNKSFCLTPERVRRPGKKSVAFSTQPPLDILTSPRKPVPGDAKPRRGILKKSNSSSLKRMKRPRVYLSENRSARWKFGITVFETESKNGVLIVKNPLYNPKEVELREYLEEIYRIHVETGEKAILDLSSRELSVIPRIVLKQTYLNVLNLYMNHFQRLPYDIGNLTNLVQFGANENSLLELPESIGELRKLNILDLRHNRLQELPKSIGQLKALQRLFLRYNRLVALPDSIGSLKQLDLLSVRNNNLTFLPDSIRKLHKLRVLDVHQNQLSRLPSLRGLNELVDLDAQYNSLSRLPKDLAKLQNLRKLHLGFNKLRNFPSEICQLTNLVELDLEGNTLKALHDDICQLNQLQQLYISRNRIAELPETFGGLVRLRQLVANCNRLKSLPASLGKLRELKEIDLGSNNFTEFPDPALFRFVTSLDIHDNMISSLPEGMGKMKSVKTLNLGENCIRSIPESFCYTTTLGHLRLNCNELETLPPNLDALVSLRTLQLDNNLFSELPPQVGFLGNLTSLSLLDNDLNDLPNELINLHKLKQLKVDGNPLECFPPNVSGGGAVFQYIGHRVKESEFGL